MTLVETIIFINVCYIRVPVFKFVIPFRALFLSFGGKRGGSQNEEISLRVILQITN